MLNYKDNNFSTINVIEDMTYRVKNNLPHPRTEELKSLAEKATVSQQEEKRSSLKWAICLTKDVFNKN